MTNGVKRVLFGFLYGCVKPLPPSYFRPFPVGGWLRRCFAAGLLESVEEGANIETGAHFSNGGLGARAVILPGVRIGRGSIVGAAAVVKKLVFPYSIVGGNPARIIRSRLA